MKPRMRRPRVMPSQKLRDMNVRRCKSGSVKLGAKIIRENDKWCVLEASAKSCIRGGRGGKEDGRRKSKNNTQ